MTTLIQHAHIVNPACDEDFLGDILIENGMIAAMGENLSCAGAQTINAAGLVAAPGLVDMHVHLRDPGLTHKEDIFTGCAAAAAGGITSLLCMPNTAPCTDTPETVRYIIEKAKHAKARVYVAAAISKNIAGSEAADLKALREAGAIALTDDGRPVENTAILQAAIAAAPGLGMTVAAHCEDLYLAKNWQMNEGALAQQLGLGGVPNTAEDCGTAREIAIAAVLGVPVHICHVSTAGACALIADAQRRGVAVTAETAPHYLLLTEEKLRTGDADYRMNPPLRTEADRLALRQAVEDGVITVIATDHAPHSPEEKADFCQAPNGVIGMETSLAGMITAMVVPGALSLAKLITYMSVNPAKILGIEAGVLAPGKPADLVLFDPKEQWTVDVNALHGKSKNAVLKDMRLTGRVHYTFLKGEITYKKGSV